jgi:hypothetical protein
MITEQVVYLAGPMAGLDKHGANDWREYATRRIENMRDPDTDKRLYQVLNPCRGRDWLTGQSGEGLFPKADKKGAGWGREVVRRDRFDLVNRSDIGLFNFNVDISIDGLSNIKRLTGPDSFGELLELCEKYPELKKAIMEEATKASIGSICEETWSNEHGKFVITVMDTDKYNVHEHAFITDFSSLIVPELDLALDYLETVLNASR